MKILSDKMQIKFDPNIIFDKKKIRFTALFDPEDLYHYEYIPDTEKIITRLNYCQTEYNDDDQTSSKLKLVFFEDALDHFLRVFRVLQYSRGNAMLIGIEGLGKQSLTKLASHILGYQLKELESRQGFTVETFKAWLRENVLNPCAGPDAAKTGKPLTFVIVDNQINDDLILEMINNLLNSGEIPNLFPQEDKEKLIANLAPVVTSSSESIDNNGVYRRYIERIRNNLHIIMCMSPIGEKLRVRCR